MQVDPIKPTLKPPGTKGSKLELDGLLSNFCFQFSLRRYTKGENIFTQGKPEGVKFHIIEKGEVAVKLSDGKEAGAYTRSHFCSTELNLSSSFRPPYNLSELIIVSWSCSS